MSYINIEGKLEAVAYACEYLTMVEFTGKFTNSSPFDENTPVIIDVSFLKDYNNRKNNHKEFHDIKGSVRYDYEYRNNKKISETKVLRINIYEDSETFKLFSKMLNDNSEISVRIIEDSVCGKEYLEFIKKEFGFDTSSDIALLNDDPDDLKGKYFIIKDYMLHTSYNQDK